MLPQEYYTDLICTFPNSKDHGNFNCLSNWLDYEFMGRRYLWNDQQQQQNTKKKRPQTTHSDKSNETEIEILNNMYQKPVAVHISDIIHMY